MMCTRKAALPPFSLALALLCFLHSSNSKTQTNSSAPVGDGYEAVCGDEAGLEDIHVLAADGVVQLEQVCVVLRDLQARHLRQRAPPLVRHVVYHQHAPRERHLVVVPVVCLHGACERESGPDYGNREHYLYWAML